MITASLFRLMLHVKTKESVGLSLSSFIKFLVLDENIVAIFMYVFFWSLQLSDPMLITLMHITCLKNLIKQSV